MHGFWDIHHKKRDLETGVRGHWRLLKMTLHVFDTPSMTSCWSSIVTMALCRAFSEIFNVEKYRDLVIPVKGQSRSLKVAPFRDKRCFQSKIAKFFHPHVFCACWRGFPWNWVTALQVKKLEWWATGPRKKFDDIFSRLDTMHERDGWTDRRTPDDSKDHAYA